MSALEESSRAAHAARSLRWDDKLVTSLVIIKRKWNQSKRVRYGAVVLVAALGVGGFTLMQPPLVETAIVTRGEALDVVYATGVADHVRRARIAPVVTAPILDVFVNEGDVVEAGQVLAQLEDGPARGAAAQADAEAQVARLARQRVNALHADGLAPRAVWEEATGRRAATEAAADAARAQLQYYAIRAPFAGRLLRRDAEIGDLAQAGEILFVIADEDSMRITVDLDERDVARVVLGQRALVRAEALPDESYEAVVTDITPQGDANARTFRVRLALSAEAPIRAGMTVEANIITAEREDAVLAPASAVVDDAVWVVRDGRAQQRAIERGVGGTMVELRSGLEAGETIILDPPAGLRDGRRIRVAAAP